MSGHPVQLLITVLVIMALSSMAGVAAEAGNMGWFWGLQFGSLVCMAFGILVPGTRNYSGYQRYHRGSDY